MRGIHCPGRELCSSLSSEERDLLGNTDKTLWPASEGRIRHVFAVVGIRPLLDLSLSTTCFLRGKSPWDGEISSLGRLSSLSLPMRGTHSLFPLPTCAQTPVSR